MNGGRRHIAPKYRTGKWLDEEDDAVRLNSVARIREIPCGYVYMSK